MKDERAPPTNMKRPAAGFRETEPGILRPAFPGRDVSADDARASESWERRLQRVRMRTKIVVPMVFLAAVPALIIGTFMIARARESLQESVVQRVAFDTATKAQAVQEFLSDVRQDIRFLSQTKAVRDLISTNAAPGTARFTMLRGEAERNFQFFQRSRPYCQAQCLNDVGQQLIRLDAKGGLLQVMPSDQPGNQANRAYVKAAKTLQSGQVYVSPMHLDIVHGMMGAMMKFATPVAGTEAGTRGFLVVGVCAHHILSQINPLPGGMEAWLADESGTYLGYVGQSPEKAPRFSVAVGRSLAADYTPEQVVTLRNSQTSRRPLATAESLIFSERINLKGDQSAQNWMLLMSYPRAAIESPIRRLTVFLSIVMVLVVAVSAVLGILITHYLARPVASLRRATREIAAGDLSKRVNITTGDEIEALAADFNTMTERLSEAQARLARWNVELEREVAQQTEKVRQLQTGLARTDKLASIGQITAGVMHEIGNPLAAIKTKIQVAEEEGGQDAAARLLLDEILIEVDRLSAFLRSFSRLARLRDSLEQREVSLREVADSVVALLAPDLRRRHLTLRCECDEITPTVRGDPEQLRHLLLNLILNAADASRDGGKVLIRIGRPADETGDEAALGLAGFEVIDHGAGISPDALERIWNPFYTTKAEGTGLGLAISAQIVQEHHGAIEIQSEPGKGTKVTVVFPEFNPATLTAQPAANESERRSPASQSRP